MNQPALTVHRPPRTKPHRVELRPGAQETTVNHHRYRFLTWREHLALGAAAAGATVLVTTGALAPFVVDGRTPYFGNDAATLVSVEHCRALPARAPRHACLRQVAAARDAAASHAVALAQPAP